MGVVVVGFAGGAADLGESEIYAEGEGGVCEVGFEVVDYLDMSVQTEMEDGSELTSCSCCGE